MFGLLRAGQLAAEGSGPVEAFMRPGPSTFRPNVPIDEMAEYMIEHDLASSPITTNQGRLVGLLRREDAAGAAPRGAGGVPTFKVGTRRITPATASRFSSSATWL